MPGKKRLRGVGAKEQRLYEHIKGYAENKRPGSPSRPSTAMLPREALPSRAGFPVHPHHAVGHKI